MGASGTRITCPNPNRVYALRSNHEHTHLEAKDDGPYKTQRQTRTAVDDVVGTHVLQVDTLIFQKLEGFFDVFQAVDTHLPFRRSRLKLK